MVSVESSRQERGGGGSAYSREKEDKTDPLIPSILYRYSHVCGGFRRFILLNYDYFVISSSVVGLLSFFTFVGFIRIAPHLIEGSHRTGGGGGDQHWGEYCREKEDT